MKKLKHFILPENTNSLYKKEARSSIALTKEVANKINELVDALNEYEKVHLEKFQEQDGRIRGAILYMKDNLVNTLNDLLEIYKASGYVDERINRYAGDLIQRLDNLIGSVKTGTTSMDAEIIDSRYGHGVTYPNSGEAIRNQVERVQHQLYFLFNQLKMDEVVKTKLVAGYIDSDLALHDAKATQMEVTTDFIELNTEDVYLISTNCNYPADGVPWVGVTYYDVDKNPLNRTSEENITEKLVVKTDANAWYFKVSARTYGNGSVTIMRKNFSHVSDTIPTYQHKYNYEYIPVKFSLGYFNSAGDILNATPIGAELHSDLVPVHPGEEYALIANAVNTVGIVGNHAGYLWGAVALYDTEGKFLYRSNTFTVTEETEDKHYSFVGDFKIPAGVGFVSVCSRTYWNGTINLALKKNISLNADNVLIDENSTSHVKAIAHRGLSSLAPENTLSAYRMAKKHGFYYVECDVRFTKDGIPVLLHDATVDRTSNGSGNISDLFLDNVLGLDFGSWFSPAYAGEMIPTFEQFISLCKRIGLHPYIEIKAGTQVQVEGLAQTVKDYGMWDDVTFIGGAPFNDYIANCFPKRLGVVVSQVTNANALEGNDLSGKAKEVFMNTGSCANGIPATFYDEVNLCKRNGLGIEVWTINNEETIMNLPAHVSGVTSDSLHAGKVLTKNL